MIVRSALILGACFCWLAHDAAQASTEPAQVDPRIERLIQQLGDSDFHLRDRAQRELSRLGVEAFDALTDAENSDDIEIASQARYLAGLVRVQWFEESDPPEIKQILKDFDSQNQATQRSRMKQLANLAHDSGLPWLCRLARFEQSRLLSKYAALLVISQEQGRDDEAWSRRAQTINKSVDRSTRPAAHWLRTYVLAHTEPASALERWIDLADAERQTLEQSPQQSSPEFLVGLLHKEVDAYDRLKKPEDAQATIRQIVAIERGDPKSLGDLVDWLAERQEWTLVDEVASRFASTFAADPLLLYTLAQARLEQGDEKQAEAAAQQALSINKDKQQDHYWIASRLQDRGLLNWSERELRRVIEIGPITSDIALSARIGKLCEMLHDQQREGAAAAVLKELLDVTDRDPNVANLVQRQLERPLGTIRSRMHFFLALQHVAEHDDARALDELDRGIEADPSDADVLIALYRLKSADAARKEKTLSLIRRAVESSRKEIEEAPDNWNAYNQLAWLVANTEGDFDEAIRCAHKAVELRREAEDRLGISPSQVGGLLDTLSHCYYAKGDYENAVKYQTEAFRLEPYTQQIGRQLQVFRAALEKQQGEKQ